MNSKLENKIKEMDLAAWNQEIRIKNAANDLNPRVKFSNLSLKDLNKLCKFYVYLQGEYKKGSVYLSKIGDLQVYIPKSIISQLHYVCKLSK